MTGDEHGAWWVLADVRRVQRYIFETNSLKQMRGASRVLLDYEKLISSIPVTDPDATVEIGQGGTYRLRADSKDKALAIEHRLRREFVEITGLSDDRLVTVIAFAGPDDDKRRSRREAAYAKLLARQARTHVGVQSGAPLERLCQTCGVRPSIANDVCGTCQERIVGAGAPPGKVWEQLEELGHAVASHELYDLGAFAEASSPSGYLALIVADVDALGQLFPSLDDDQQQQLSKKLAGAVQAGVLAAIDAAVAWSSRDACEWPVMMPQWIGGDDAVLVVPPESAHACAEALVRGFTGHDFSIDSVTYPRGDTPTLSVGVVIAHASLPAYLLLDLGESLLHRAKAASHAQFAKDPASSRTTAGWVDIDVVKASMGSPSPNTEAAVDAAGPPDLAPIPVFRADVSADGGLRQLIDDSRELLEMEAPRRRMRHWLNDPTVFDSTEMEHVSAITNRWLSRRAELLLAYETFRTMRATDHRREELAR